MGIPLAEKWVFDRIKLRLLLDNLHILAPYVEMAGLFL